MFVSVFKGNPLRHIEIERPREGGEVTDRGREPERERKRGRGEGEGGGRGKGKERERERKLPWQGRAGTS